MPVKRITPTQRIEALESVSSNIDTRITMVEQHMADQTKWLQNGLGDKIATAVSSAINAHQKEIAAEERENRRLQLEEYRAKNEVMGKSKDRRNVLLIAAMPVVAGFVMFGLSKIFGV